MTHGLTDNAARFEYQDESGALNESYSDIFGIIIANSDEPNVDDWNWEMRWAKNSTAQECRCMKGARPHGAEEIWMTESNTTLSLR
jgi:hypothetical protein